MPHQHNEFLQRAIVALKERTFYAAFPEHPKAYDEDGDQKGQEAFKNQLNKAYPGLDNPRGKSLGEEISPYTLKPLGISYPEIPAEVLINNANQAWKPWRNTPVDERACLLIDSLFGLKDRFFELAYATMHTTGQGYMMAFQASGPHSADRALEAIAAGYEELTKYPEHVVWDKPMGKFNITLNKTWKPVPKGISLVIGCSTFPVWNSLPGIYASLITGNPVIIKPHPGAILPLAMVVDEINKVLNEYGLPSGICQLAPDKPENPIALELAKHEEVKIIDFTGNSSFGSQLEKLEGKVVFTEKTGVNSVLLHSASDPDQMAANLGFSINLYSGQMCTAPQNFFIPEDGIDTPNGKLSFDEVVQKISDQISSLANNPKAGPYVLGAIQNPATCNRLDDLLVRGKKVWLKSSEIENPMFPESRTRSPLIIEVSAEDKELFSQELFGPIALFIKTKNIEESVSLASELAKKHGAISCAAYTTDEKVKELIMEEMGLAGTPVSFNLYGGIYVNQNAGFSDFHVTGGNPAGNASITDAQFVSDRFTWVGFREMVKT